MMSGVYRVVNELGLAIVPLGAVQVAEVAPPPIEPEICTELPAHTSTLAPPFTVAGGFDMTTKV
jgi:hypothetical protein